jgi:putative phosphoesterase
MKILVLSDSHSTLSFMRHCIDAVKPDRMIHLGDYYDDACAIAEEYPSLPVIQVPGNCDRYRCPPFAQEMMVQKLDGVTFFLTHGHCHSVKMRLDLLLRDARRAKAAAALYGHTHIADCHQEESGLWVLNPGSCGYYGGSAGLIETENGKIVNCRLLRQEDLEEFL